MVAGLGTGVSGQAADIYNRLIGMGTTLSEKTQFLSPFMPEITGNLARQMASQQEAYRRRLLQQQAMTGGLTAGSMARLEGGMVRTGQATMAEQLANALMQTRQFDINAEMEAKRLGSTVMGAGATGLQQQAEQAYAERVAEYNARMAQENARQAKKSQKWQLGASLLGTLLTLPIGGIGGSIGGALASKMLPSLFGATTQSTPMSRMMTAQKAGVDVSNIFSNMTDWEKIMLYQNQPMTRKQDYTTPGYYAR